MTLRKQIPDRDRALVESLLEDAFPRNADRCGAILTLFLSLIGLGYAVHSRGEGWQRHVQAPAISMQILPVSSGGQLLPFSSRQWLTSKNQATQHYQDEGMTPKFRKAHATFASAPRQVTVRYEFNKWQKPTPAPPVPFRLPEELSKVTPMGNQVLIKVKESETKTKGGLVLNLPSQQKNTCGTVVAVGDGETLLGKRHMELKPGDFVIWSAFGVAITDFEIEGKDHIIISEDDILGKLPEFDLKSGGKFSVKNVKELQPLSDRVFIRQDELPETTKGGFITGPSDERPSEGIVLRIGPGKPSNGNTDMPPEMPLDIGEGDHILYNKYAVETITRDPKESYAVVSYSDIIGRRSRSEE